MDIEAYIRVIIKSNGNKQEIMDLIFTILGRLAFELNNREDTRHVSLRFSNGRAPEFKKGPVDSLPLISTKFPPME